MSAQYTVHTAKAVETILWVANARPGIDLYHLIKTVYFADRSHVAKYGRPIFGENYKADTYGPKGTTVYGLLNGDAMEQIALGNNGPLPFKLGEAWTVIADRDANERMLSASDIAALKSALDKVADMSFEDLVEITHNDPAYQAANGGRIKYEDMLDSNDPKYEVLAEDLSESARTLAF
jgi:uncharacterized phage-associated protein